MLGNALRRILEFGMHEKNVRSLQHRKRIRITNALCYFVILNALALLFKGVAEGALFGSFASAVVILVFIAFLWLNHMGRDAISRTYLGPATLLVLFGIILVEGHFHSLEYYLFLVPAGCFLLLDPAEKRARMISLTASLLLMTFPLYLAVTDFQGLLPVLANESPHKRSLERAFNYVMAVGVNLFMFWTQWRENLAVEEAIEQKRQDMKAILDNIPVGIFSMSRADLVIDSDRSLTLDSMLETGKSSLPMTLDSILLDRVDLSMDRKAQIRSVIGASIGDDPLTFEVNAGLLPSELGLGSRILEIDWDYVPTADQAAVKKVLVSLRDVTELRQYQYAARKQDESMLKVVELVSVEPRKISHFLKSARGYLRENLDLCDEVLDRQRALRLIFINLHTIKGEARTLGLKDLTEVVHRAEECIVEMQKGGRFDSERLRQDTVSVREVIDEYAMISREKLSRSDDSMDEIMLKRECITRLADSLIKGQVPSREDFHFIVAAAYVPADALIAEATKAVPRLARDLGKVSPIIVSEGFDDVFLTSDSYSVLSGAFVHIIRNSMDHGLELPEERLLKGKPEQGLLSITAKRSHDVFTIHVRDDGRGLALKALKEKGIKAEIIAEDAGDLQIANLIFEIGMSTAAQTSEISGRGVGMGAVRRLILQLGGRLEVELGQGDGVHSPFQFRLDLPLSCLRFFPADHTVSCVLDVSRSA